MNRVGIAGYLNLIEERDQISSNLKNLLILSKKDSKEFGEFEPQKRRWLFQFENKHVKQKVIFVYKEP